MEISVTNWGITKNNENVKCYTLKNEFLEVEILNYGGVIRKISSPDKNGKMENVVLNLSNITDYEERSPYFGAIVGRNAGRIANGCITINGIKYSLAKNNGENNLHGGIDNFSHKIWDSKEIKGENYVGVELSLKSPHLEEGFPGNILATVTYKLIDNELVIEYNATSDMDTYLNLTNHTYFNLSGDFKRDVSDEYLTLACKEFIAVDETTLPVKVTSVEGTPFDFQKSKELAPALNSDHEQIVIVNHGLDHPFILDETREGSAAILEDKVSGKKLEVYTDQPAVVIYSGNYLYEIGKLSDGSDCKKHMGICFETQDYPNVLNFMPEKAKIYNSSKAYSQKTVFKFTTI